MNIITLFKKIKLLFLKRKLIIGLNYHRVGEFNKKSSFQFLHTVNLKIFKIQISIIKLFFKILSIEDIRRKKLTSKINFFITFDDVPSVSKDAIFWLVKKKIPYTLCPNIFTTENGYNFRDKVRFISFKVNKNEIIERIGNHINEKEKNILIQKGINKLSKSLHLNLFKFKDIFNKHLFEKFKNEFDLEIKNNHYLNWSQLKNFSTTGTIASHGYNHDNFIHLDFNQLSKELKLSKEILETKIDSSTNIFAVPFGGYSDDLAIKLSKISKDVGYNQILWCGNQGLIYSGKKLHQVDHLVRVNCPSNLFNFIKTIINAIVKSRIVINEDFEQSKILKNEKDNYKIEENQSVEDIAAFENIVRLGKDYSSNKKMIKNIYIDNPFREKKPYSFGVLKENTIHGIHYNLYKNYFFNSKKYKIMESSGYRKLKNLSPNYNSMLYLNALNTSEILYSWRPSIFLSKHYGNNENYFEIKNYETKFVIKKYPYENNIEFNIYNECPNNVSNFLNQFNKKYYFCLDRSIEFYKWRVDTYPIGEKKYIIQTTNNEIKSILITQIYQNKALIIDLLSLETENSLNILRFFINYCKDKNLKNVKFSTSDQLLNLKINKEFESRTEIFNSYLYIKKLVDNNLIDFEKLKNAQSSETYVCGDVLIR